MPKKPISDELYRKELDRLRMLPKFPEVPTTQQEMIRVLRRITETDVRFLHELITGFVDAAEACPRPCDLYERASAMRGEWATKPLGDPACPSCGGSGWLRGTRTVKVPGMQPYEADYSERCTCGGSRT